MDIEQLKSMKAPFDVVDKDGNRHTIIGFKQNDPLGVGGGIFPDMPVAYFHGGGWLLVSDVLRHYEIAAQQSVQADGACTCALIKNETELVIDDLCPVHGSPRR